MRVRIWLRTALMCPFSLSSRGGSQQTTDRQLCPWAAPSQAQSLQSCRRRSPQGSSAFSCKPAHSSLTGPWKAPPACPSLCRQRGSKYSCLLLLSLTRKIPALCGLTVRQRSEQLKTSVMPSGTTQRTPPGLPRALPAYRLLCSNAHPQPPAATSCPGRQMTSRDIAQKSCKR